VSPTCHQCQTTENARDEQLLMFVHSFIEKNFSLRTMLLWDGPRLSLPSPLESHDHLNLGSWLMMTSGTAFCKRRTARIKPFQATTSILGRWEQRTLIYVDRSTALNNSSKQNTCIALCAKPFHFHLALGWDWEGHRLFLSSGFQVGDWTVSSFARRMTQWFIGV